MKCSILSKLVVTLGLSAAFGPIALMAQGEIRTIIPFDFTVGTKSLAAGEYSFQQVKGNTFTIRSVHGHAGVLAETMPSGEEVRAGMAVITFRRYGDTYFLSQVSNGGRGWALYQSQAEKQLLAKNAAPRRVAVAVALATK